MYGLIGFHNSVTQTCVVVTYFAYFVAYRSTGPVDFGMAMAVSVVCMFAGGVVEYNFESQPFMG